MKGNCDPETRAIIHFPLHTHYKTLWCSFSSKCNLWLSSPDWLSDCGDWRRRLRHSHDPLSEAQSLVFLQHLFSLWLAMDIRAGQHIPLSSNALPNQGKSSDPAELPRWISDIAVRYLLSCKQILWPARLICAWFFLQHRLLWVTNAQKREERYETHYLFT